MKLLITYYPYVSLKFEEYLLIFPQVVHVLFFQNSVLLAFKVDLIINNGSWLELYIHLNHAHSALLLKFLLSKLRFIISFLIDKT